MRDMDSADLACGCGVTGPEVRYASGNPECPACWSWRKLDAPAARYWADRGERLLENVDYHDLLTYLPSVLGSQEAASAFLNALVKVTLRSAALRAQHGAPMTPRLERAILDAEHDAYAEEASIKERDERWAASGPHFGS